MRTEIAVVDTSVLILIGVPSTEPKTEPRRLRALETMKELQKAGARFVVPAPAIAELFGEGPGHQIATRIMKPLGGMQVEALDVRAASHAGKSLEQNLKARARGDSRGAVKYDALLAGIAHAIGAKYLVTDNARDFEKHFKAMNSSVEVLVAGEPPKKGQLRLVDQGG